MLGRVIGTVAVLGVAGFSHNLWGVSQRMVSGDVAGVQFSNSNAAAVFNEGVQNSLGLINSGLELATLLILVLIWWKPIKTAFKNLMEGED